jgi:hypothetical protein
MLIVKYRKTKGFKNEIVQQKRSRTHQSVTKSFGTKMNMDQSSAIYVDNRRKNAEAYWRLLSLLQPFQGLGNRLVSKEGASNAHHALAHYPSPPQGSAPHFSAQHSLLASSGSAPVGPQELPTPQRA